MLTLISIPDGTKTGGNFKALFRCSCGKEIYKNYKNVIYNKKGLSCGCIPKVSFTTHKMSGSRFYRIYNKLADRCDNPKSPCYHRYGGRGIKNLWGSFEVFKHDMLDSYNKHVAKFGEKETTIDRINNDGNYCKENCRWATNFEQAQNTSLLVRVNGKSLSEWARQQGLTRQALSYRYKKFGRV